MRFPKIATLLFLVALIAAACSEATPNADSEGGALSDGVVVAEDAVAAGSTHDEATASDEAATHDEESTNDDEAARDAEATHEESTHDEAATHDEGAGHNEAASHDETSGDYDREVEVVMSEFAFAPDSITVAAGETIKFHVVNGGAVEHEFRLTTGHAAEEHIASGHAGHNEGGEEGGHAHGEVVLVVAPGASEAVTVSFDADADYDIVACLIPGHFEAGMHGDVRIEA